MHCRRHMCILLRCSFFFSSFLYSRLKMRRRMHISNTRLLVFRGKNRAIFRFDKVPGLGRYLCFMHPHKWICSQSIPVKQWAQCWLCVDGNSTSPSTTQCIRLRRRNISSDLTRTTATVIKKWLRRKRSVCFTIYVFSMNLLFEYAPVG